MLCPVCTNEFNPGYARQKFCCDECCKRYFSRVKTLFGSYKKFKRWLNSNLIDWNSYNEFIL